MDRQQQIEMIRKRNIDLSKQLEELRTKVELCDALDGNAYSEAKDLISDCEKARNAWYLALDDIKKKQSEYEDLISELKNVLPLMRKVGDIYNTYGRYGKLPWYTKLYLKVTRRYWMNIAAKANIAATQSEHSSA